MPKMNVNLTLTKDYRKNDCLAAQKTNPNKAKANPISKGQNELKIACRKIRPHPHPPRFNCALYKKSFVWHYVTVNMTESVQ